MSTKTARKCRTCGKPGHNKRTCGQSKQVIPIKDVPSVTSTRELPESDTEVDACPICMENLGNTNSCITKCGHKFCLECMFKHSKTKSNCPLCRADLPGAGSIINPVQQHRGPAPAPQPRLSLQIDNFTEQARDVWWLPSPARHSSRHLPRKVQSNIRANSSRTTHVAAQGDKFLIVNAGTDPVPRPAGYSRYGPTITTNRPFSHFMLTSTGVYDIYNSAYSIE